MAFDVDLITPGLPLPHEWRSEILQLSRFRPPPMSLLISSILFLAGMEYLYASMSPLPYVVVAIGALAVV